MIEEIETKEQNLIQRVRTSGLSQAREITIVDEILDIRKERRRFFSKLNKEIGQLQNMVQKWTQQATELQKTCDEQRIEFERREKSISSQAEESIHKLKQDINAQHQQELVATKNENIQALEIVRQEYEDKISSLQSRLEICVSEHKNNDLSQAKVIANKLVKRISTELEEKFERKANEWKESLLQMEAREKELERALSAKHKELDNMKVQERSLIETLNSLQSKLETSFKREKDLEKRHTLLVIEVESMRAIKQSQSTELEEIKRSHELALQSVDEKVRRMLDSKDREIASLNTQVSSLLREKAELEGVFSDLNNELQNVRGPGNRS